MNSLTPENALKWELIHPFEDRFCFSAGDSIVKFASALNMRVHGHTLCWHESNPVWLKEYTGDRGCWEALLRDHILRVVSHYRGGIGSWDVLNEAFHDDGSLRGDAPHDQGKENPWSKNLGWDYIPLAFRYAHSADPNAYLFYNDFGQEDAPGKRKAILQLVDLLRKEGTPIHGLGLQMHLTIHSSRSGISDSIREMAGTGLKIHISELEFAVNPQKDEHLEYNDVLLKAQHDLCTFVIDQYRRWVPREQQFGITTWNLGDGDSWLRSVYNPQRRMDWPLLFDQEYNRKSLYYQFRKGLGKA